MATALHGSNGQVKVNGTAVAMVDNWSADIEVSYDDITSMDSSGWQMEKPGLKKVTGSVAVRYAEDDTNGQTVLYNNAIGGTAVTLALFASGTAHNLSGTAFLKVGVKSTHDDVAGAAYDFISHGPWAYA